MRLSNLKNISPMTELMLNEIGIHTPDDLERVGPMEAYILLKRNHPGEMSLVGLYALQGALLDLHRNELPQDVKEEIKEQVAYQLADQTLYM